MNTKKKPGRKAADGVTYANARINAVVTEEHKRRLEKLATEGFSVWIRNAIDSAWNKRKARA